MPPTPAGKVRDTCGAPVPGGGARAPGSPRPPSRPRARPPRLEQRSAANSPGGGPAAPPPHAGRAAGVPAAGSPPRPPPAAHLAGAELPLQLAVAVVPHQVVQRVPALRPLPGGGGGGEHRPLLMPGPRRPAREEGRRRGRGAGPRGAGPALPAGEAAARACASGAGGRRRAARRGPPARGGGGGGRGRGSGSGGADSRPVSRTPAHKDAAWRGERARGRTGRGAPGTPPPPGRAPTAPGFPQPHSPALCRSGCEGCGDAGEKGGELGAPDRAGYSAAPRHDGACSPPCGTEGGEWPGSAPHSLPLIP